LRVVLAFYDPAVDEVQAGIAKTRADQALGGDDQRNGEKKRAQQAKSSRKLVLGVGPIASPLRADSRSSGTQVTAIEAMLRRAMEGPVP
jgi:hypothetical protein